jgi:hypothetical protein
VRYSFRRAVHVALRAGNASRVREAIHEVPCHANCGEVSAGVLQVCVG